MAGYTHWRGYRDFVWNMTMQDLVQKAPEASPNSSQSHQQSTNPHITGCTAAPGL